MTDSDVLFFHCSGRSEGSSSAVADEKFQTGWKWCVDQKHEFINRSSQNISNIKATKTLKIKSNNPLPISVVSLLTKSQNRSSAQAFQECTTTFTYAVTSLWEFEIAMSARVNAWQICLILFVIILYVSLFFIHSFIHYCLKWSVTFLATLYNKDSLANIS